MTTTVTDGTGTGRLTVHRVEVHPLASAGDPAADAVVREAATLGIPVRSARTARVYLIECEGGPGIAERAASGLLADPVSERAIIGVSPPRPGWTSIEVHPLPGVTDPAAGSVREALAEVFGVRAQVSTGRRYEFEGVEPAAARALAERLLANRVVSGVHEGAYHPDRLPSGRAYQLSVRRVAIRGLDDPGLNRLSREGHLFLSLEEMRAIRAHYEALGREPTDIELETLAQTWSEHCVHKTLKSTVIYTQEGGRGGGGGGPGEIDWRGRPGVTIEEGGAGKEGGAVRIDNLLRSTVAAATHRLIADGVGWCLSVFKDNAGVIAFDDETAVCVKVETHNRPSALEPYGGAATGIGGCIRDIIGTGLGARPIASTDVFCVATPGLSSRPGGVPPGCLPPRRILSEVVAGVRDYGNRMGIPTVNGAVSFDDRYVGNPLVYCGCVGVMPRSLVEGRARAGDRIVALGGRTGRDGIHGATFSSGELTGAHADEFGHAVQIGHAIEEKRLLEAILRARGDGGPAGCLYHAITDCGAGGFSSAVGEMGADLGAEVDLDRAPLKYQGLSYTEVWISEAQERMVLAVPPENMAALRAICRAEHVEMSDLGRFGTDTQELVLRYLGTEVGRLDTAFLHGGVPMPVRQAVWAPKAPGAVAVTSAGAEPGRLTRGGPAEGLAEGLLRRLGDPNIASKHWIIRQYDHGVQGNTALRPLGGPLQRGPMDAAVIEPVPGKGRGLAIGCGLATPVGDPALGGDPYLMALAAIDECVRNLVCVGADPGRIAILDNFCWPSCQRPANMAALVRACVGCYDGAIAYRTPFISGKDSLNNQFVRTDGSVIEIPPTLLITGVGVVDDITRCVSSDAKRPGRRLVLVRGDGTAVGNAAAARAVAGLIRAGAVASAHDVSDGGALVTIAEMLIGGSTPARPIGAAIDPAALGDPFEEAPGRYVLEMIVDPPLDLDGADWRTLGELNDTGRLVLGGSAEIEVEAMAAAWLGPLDW